jgi:hypothetical protein
MCSRTSSCTAPQDEFDEARDALAAAAQAYAAVHLNDVDGEGKRVPIVAADIELADEIRTVEVIQHKALPSHKWMSLSHEWMDFAVNASLGDLMSGM